jgi:hypothetical protein
LMNYYKKNNDLKPVLSCLIALVLTVVQQSKKILQLIKMAL